MCTFGRSQHQQPIHKIADLRAQEERLAQQQLFALAVCTARLQATTGRQHPDSGRSLSAFLATLPAGGKEAISPASVWLLGSLAIGKLTHSRKRVPLAPSTLANDDASCCLGDKRSIPSIKESASPSPLLFFSSCVSVRPVVCVLNDRCHNVWKDIYPYHDRLLSSCVILSMRCALFRTRLL